MFFRKNKSNSFEVKNYSPMTRVEKVFYLILITVGLFTTIRYLVWWFNPQHLPNNWFHDSFNYSFIFDYLLFGFLSFVVFIGLFLRVGTWFTTWFMRRPRHEDPPEGLRVAFLTCYVPGDEPLEMLEETLAAMRDADYKHDTWVLDEGNTDEVKLICKKLGINYFSRKGLEHYNQNQGWFKKKTKAGNLNSWRNEYEHLYDIVAQVDMDHLPYRNYLTKQLGYFKDPKVGFVGAPQVYKNTNNWIARGASEQTHFYYGPMQQGFYGANMPFLIGTTHVYRVEAMKNFGGYIPTIAEDYLTGVYFFSNGWKGVYLPQVVAEGHGPVNWVGYFNQQTRWSYGLFEILFKHSYKHFFKLTLKQKINIFYSQLFYFTGLSTFFGVILIFLYLAFGITSANMKFNEWISYSFPAYLSGMMIMVYLHKYYIDPKNEPVIGLRGMIISQMANIIYTLAFIKFLTRGKLTYVVTSKNNSSNIRGGGIKIFKPFLIIIYFLSWGLIFSIIFNHESLVMRFWAIYTTLFFSGLITVSYLEDLKIIYYKFKDFILPFKKIQFEDGV